MSSTPISSQPPALRPGAQTVQSDPLEAHWLLLEDRWYKASLRRSIWQQLWATAKRYRAVAGRRVVAVCLSLRDFDRLARG